MLESDPLLSAWAEPLSQLLPGAASAGHLLKVKVPGGQLQVGREHASILQHSSFRLPPPHLQQPAPERDGEKTGGTRAGWGEAARCTAASWSPAPPPAPVNPSLQQWAVINYYS